MIPQPSPERQTISWQQELARAIRDPAELLTLLDLPTDLLHGAGTGAQLFPLLVPHPFLARIKPGDPHDPLLRQVLPLQEESLRVPGFTTDPVGDEAAIVAPGLLHKYHGRALLITTQACGIHCRYCFRRSFPYQPQRAGNDPWAGAIDWLEQHPEIHELILSGGDPLTLGDRKLARLLDRLEGVSSLRTLRLHTRLPVVIPARLTPPLRARLELSRLRVVLVLHANHPQEIDEHLTEQCRRLARTGVTLLNQAVLLRGVNDSAKCLTDLSEQLFQASVLPYYLHQLDPVQGAAHFQVPTDRARLLHQRIAAHLPGYLVPRLVQETPGHPCKTDLYTSGFGAPPLD